MAGLNPGHFDSIAALRGHWRSTSRLIALQNWGLTEYAAAAVRPTTDLQQEIPMLANRYIQTVLTHDLIQEMKDVDSIAPSERETLSDDRQERAQQLMSRFVGIGLTVDG
jgi:hypothetical protein